MKLLLFGLGYSCLYFVRTRGLANVVAGTTMTHEKAELLSKEGIRAAVFDGVRFDAWLPAAISECDAVIASIPPDAAGDPVLRCFAPALRASNQTSRILYLSTIGVYGDRAGEWVDEDAPPRPISVRSRERLEAENAWRRLGDATGKAVHVLRLAGIYGPGRNALVTVADGTARRINKPGQIFNRIHVEDIARTLSACLGSQRSGGVWNVADNEPAPGPDIIERAAALLNKPPPPEIAFESADLSPMARSFYGESKRVCNRRLKQELGVALAFPTYREGLKALRESGQGSAG